MASFKLSIARIRGCPKPKEVDRLLEQFGLPEGEEYGVLNHSCNDATVSAAIVRKTNQAFQKLDPETREITSGQIEKVAIIPFTILPSKELLEIYAGSASSIKEIGAFLSSCLALSTVVEAIEVDVPSAVQKLAEGQKKFQLRQVRVSDYSHNSFAVGPYAPKFGDTEHAREFMTEFVAGVTSVSVRFQGPNGKVTASLSPTACFSFSCHEDDPPAIKAILRGLA